MAAFAATVDRMDPNIGRVIQDLETKGELDNTLILFTADNGASAEWDPWGFDMRSGPDNILHTGEKLNQMGQPGTYHSYGSAWANTGNYAVAPLQALHARGRHIVPDDRTLAFRLEDAQRHYG